MRFLILTLYLFVYSYTFFAQSDLVKIEEKAYSLISKNPDKARLLAEQLLDKSSQDDTSKFKINAYTILGLINKGKGYYISSLNYYLKALESSEKKGDNGRISASLNNIGVLYQLQGNFELAAKYFSKSLKIEEKLNNPLQKSIRLFNLGDSYKELGKNELALSYYNSSLLIEQKNKNKEGINWAYLGIAEVYLNLDQLIDVARILSDLEKEIKPNDLEMFLIFNKLKGLFLLKSKDFQQSLSYLTKAEKLSKDYSFPIHLTEIYKIQIEVLEKLQDWKLIAFKYREMNVFNEKMNAIAIKNKINDMTFHYEIHKKEVEFSRLQGQRDLDAKIKSYNYKMLGLLTLMLLGVVGFVFYMFKYKIGK